MIGIMSNTWSAENIRKNLGTDKDLLAAVRLAVSGKTYGPPLFESLEILGKEETLKRLRNAIEYLKGKQ